MSALGWRGPATRGGLRLAALAVLIPAAIGCSKPDPVAELTAQLQSTDADQRIAAADALRELGPSAGSAVPALARCLTDLHPGLRQAAARALGEMRNDAEPAQRALQAVLNDPEMSVRMTAAWSLHRLDPDGDRHIPVLTSAMRAGEGGTIVAVGRLGPQARWALPTLTGLLRDERPGVRRLAADAIGKIGPDAAARAALQQATQDPDDRVRAAASAALQPVPPESGA
jgi:HEAT repeat protein